MAERSEAGRHAHDCARGVLRRWQEFHSLIDTSHQTHAVGRFALTPLTRKTDCGRYLASLSIRSGRGTASHDRVYRFVPLFASSQAAAQYGLEQGIEYARQHQCPAAV